MTKQKVAKKIDKERLVTGVVVSVLIVIFIVGFIIGLDMVLALEGSYPPIDLTEGAVPPPSTAEEAIKLLAEATDKSIAEKPAVHYAQRFSLAEDGVSQEGDGNKDLQNYLRLLADTMNKDGQPLHDLLKNAYPEADSGFGEDASNTLPALSLTPSDVKKVTCDYIYYKCPSCEREISEPAEKCEECGSPRPYEEKYRDDYVVTLTLIDSESVLDQNFEPRDPDAVRGMFGGDNGERFRIADYKDASTELQIIYRIDRMSLELRSLTRSRLITADAALTFGDDLKDLGTQNVTIRLKKSDEYALTWPSLELNVHELSIEPGSTDNLLATLTCDEPTEMTVVWTSSDDKIVSVDEEGYLDAGKTVGAAEITATFTFQGKEYSDSCTVSVKKSVESLRLNSRKKKIGVGQTVQMKSRTKPGDASIQTVTWHTEDESIAKVDENGLVTGVAPGKTTVYAISDDGWFRASCEVTVNG